VLSKPWVEHNFNTVSVDFHCLSKGSSTNALGIQIQHWEKKKTNFYRLMTVMLDSGVVWLLYRLVPIAMYLLRMAFEFM